MAKRPRQERNIIMNTSQTDWKAIDALEDKDIDLSDSPEITPDQFSKAIVRKNLKLVTKSKVAPLVDTDSNLE